MTAVIIIINQAEGTKWTRALMHQNMQNKLRNEERSTEYLIALNPGIDGKNQNLLAAE